MTRAMWASGARSPLAPREPREGTSGCTPLFSIPRSWPTTAGRTPEWPFARAFARISIEARTSSSGRGGPAPAAWLRTRFSWRRRASFLEIGTFSSWPKPVVTPYAGRPLFTISSKAACEASMRRSPAWPSFTGSPLRATRTTSSTVSDSPSIVSRRRPPGREGAGAIKALRGREARETRTRKGSYRHSRFRARADRLPRDERLVAHPEAERVRDRGEAGARDRPLRLRRGDPAAVHGL